MQGYSKGHLFDIPWQEKYLKALRQRKSEVCTVQYGVVTKDFSTRINLTLAVLSFGEPEAK